MAGGTRWSLVRLMAETVLMGCLGAGVASASVERYPVYMASRFASTVSVLDPAGGRTVGTGPVAAGAALGDLAFSPDGALLYATTGIGLAVLDPTTLVVIRMIESSVPRPYYRIAVSPDGRQAAISDARGSVSFVDLLEGKFEGETETWGPSFQGIEGLAYSADGRLVYATASASSPTGFAGATGFVLFVDPRTQMIVNVLETGRLAHSVVVTADGRRAYVAGGYAVTEVDLETVSVAAVIPIDSPAGDIALDPDETRVYVTGFSNLEPPPPWLITVDIGTHQVVHRLPIAGCGNGRRVAITPDGAFAIVLINEVSAGAVIDLHQGMVTAFLLVDPEPFGLAVAPRMGIPRESLPASPPDSPAEFDRWTCGTTLLELGWAEGRPGREATIEVRMDTRREVAGVQNDIVLDPMLVDPESPVDCALSPEISNDLDECSDVPLRLPCKQLYTHLSQCDGRVPCPHGWRQLKILVLSISNINPIPSGVLYRCTFRIAEEANLEVRAPLFCQNALASSASGWPIPVTCLHGEVVPPGRTPSADRTRPPPWVTPATPSPTHTAQHLKLNPSPVSIAPLELGESNAPSRPGGHGSGCSIRSDAPSALAWMHLFPVAWLLRRRSLLDSASRR